MRNRSYVFDGVDFKTCSLQCADSSFTAGSRTFYENFYLTEAMFHSSFGSLFSSHLCSERSALTGTAETEAAGGSPGDRVACVSVTVTMVLLNEERIWTWPRSMFFRSRRRRMTFLPADAFAVAILVLPPYFFLLATVRLGPLRYGRWSWTAGAHRQALAVTDTAVAADLGQPLDVHSHVAAQVTLHGVLVLMISRSLASSSSVRSFTRVSGLIPALARILLALVRPMP